jgi:hypothetical protein
MEIFVGIYMRPRRSPSVEAQGTTEKAELAFFHGLDPEISFASSTSLLKVFGF